VATFEPGTLNGEPLGFGESESLPGHLKPNTRSPKHGRSRIRTWIMTVDVTVIVSAVLIVSALRYPGNDWRPGVGLFFTIFACWFAKTKLYQSRVITRRSDEIRRIGQAGWATAATVGLAAFVFSLDIDRVWLGSITVLSVVLLNIERELVRRRLVAMRTAGRLARRVVIIGDNAESGRFTDMLAEDTSLGYKVVEQVDPSTVDSPIGLTTAALAAARKHNAQGAVIAATALDMTTTNRLIRDMVEAGLHVELSSTLADISSDRLTVRPLGRFPVVYIEPRSRNGWRATAKRAFDLTIAGSTLAALSPMLAVITIAVKLGSDGPVLFQQERVGQNGERFMVLKFRTMVTNAEELKAELSQANEGAGPLFKMKEDPRVTGIGRWLRRTSLDELPQLWNVMRNEMSLVGPRPALWSETAQWSDELFGRLRVKPGITGMWQVSGRSSTSFEEYTRLDLYYVDNWSLVVDLGILAKTIPAVLSSSGAY